MIKSFTFLLVLIFTFKTLAYASLPPSSFAEIVEKASPAVVNISTTKKIEIKNKNLSLNDLYENPYEFFEFFEHDMGRKSRKTTSLGSGFIIDPEGYIVTNYHIIAQADEINITLGDENAERYKAKVLGKDVKTDLALLKIDSKTPLPSVKFGNSNEARVGDFIIAIGNPFGLGGTVTAGIISAKARYLNGSLYDDLIQTDASINRGNSGGPMFNMKGEVIGINTLIISSSSGGGNIGIGFAIPAESAEVIIEQLRTKGEISRGWLGIKIQNVDENIAKAMKLNKIRGAIIAEVTKDSPADKAGLKIGDIITRFDGKEVANNNKLVKMTSNTPINKRVSIQVFRNGKYEILYAVIEKPTDDPFNEEEVDSEEEQEPEKVGKVVLGMRVTDLNNSLKKKYKIDQLTTGVIVIGVNRNSPAIDVGIDTGDIIQQVNQKKITNLQEFENIINSMKTAGEKKVVFLISRNSETRFATLDIE